MSIEVVNTDLIPRWIESAAGRSFCPLRSQDTLSQASKSESEGCCFLSVVTRFFKWLFCCGSKELPEWSAEELAAQLNPKVLERFLITYEVKKLSRDSFGITVNHMRGSSEYSCERVIYEGEAALQLKGKWDDQSFFFFHAFPKSTTLLLEGLPECLFDYASNFCSQEGKFFMRSAELAGPAELGTEG